MKRGRKDKKRIQVESGKKEGEREGIMKKSWIKENGGRE